MRHTLPCAANLQYCLARSQRWLGLSIVIGLTALVLWPGSAAAQDIGIRYGSQVPAEAKLVYDRGLTYLEKTQQEDGSWGGGRGSQNQNGITGLCMMAFLAAGEDPNFGRYNSIIRKALRHIIQSQDPRTGYIPETMYNHGFATLALAEAYGAVDETMLWDEDITGSSSKRSIGAALELAVRRAVTSQKHSKLGGWRYSPEASDADTSVSGAVLVGLLAARNAGIEVPDECIDKALSYYRGQTSETGLVSYQVSSGGPGDSMNRAAIAVLVLAVGKKKDWKEYQAALGHITSRLEHDEQHYPFYFRYYMAQALFQGDFEAWNDWNRENTRRLKTIQLDDGSFQSSHGQPYATAMSLLSIALNYRFLPVYER